MKNLLFLIVVLAILFNVTVVSADGENPCDRKCAEDVQQGKLSEAQIKSIGYGNVVRAVTSYLDGNLQGALESAGLAPNTLAANANANVIYGTKLDGTIYELFLCRPEVQIFEPVGCPDNAIWGWRYNREKKEYMQIICTTEGCNEIQW